MSPRPTIRPASSAPRKDQDITDMLIAGELDAAVYGAELPKDPRLQSVIPDPEAAARGWYGKHGLVPVNHMVVVTDELVRSNPKAVAELYRLLEEGKKAAAAGRRPDRHRAVRQGSQPALPGVADVILRAAETDFAAAEFRRTLVTNANSLDKGVRSR